MDRAKAKPINAGLRGDGYRIEDRALAIHGRVRISIVPHVQEARQLAIL
jgi:hypothetical protein